MPIPVLGIYKYHTNHFVCECKMKSVQVSEGSQTRTLCLKCLKQSFLAENHRLTARAVHFLFSGSAFCHYKNLSPHETCRGWVLCRILSVESSSWWKWSAGRALAAQGLTHTGHSSFYHIQYESSESLWKLTWSIQPCSLLHSWLYETSEGD